ncbi:MAG: TonB-dependent receptor [Bacteroidales bacterium]|nr:TonB-dependent receptor [Candidatus Cryptobacteroides onthequi]
MRLLLTGLLLAFLPAALYAQTSSIRAKVLDAVTGKPVEYADAIVKAESGDVSSDGAVIATGIVLDGSLDIEKIAPGEASLHLLMIGYEPLLMPLTLQKGKTLDLGTIMMNPSAETLDGAVLAGEKNPVTYKLDRQSISASAAVTASGGTALDILSTSPSVQVDAEGNVALRGSSSFLVYVDGKPSPLEGAEALQNIPAATVDNIEVITTPSARYKTDGDAGIINITTKRSRESGWSGLLSTSGSNQGTYSLDAVLNYQAGSHNFYFGGTKQEIKSRSDFHQEKTTDVSGVQTKSIADGERLTNSITNTLKAGWQYNDGTHHNLSLDFLYGMTKRWRGGDMSYEVDRNYHGVDHAFWIAAHPLHDEYDSRDRYSNSKDLFQAALGYVWTINSRSSVILSNRFRYDSFSREYTESNMIDKSGERQEGTRGYEDEHHWDCDGSLTYKLSYGENGHFESGYQYTTYSEHGNFSFKEWDSLKKDFFWRDDIYNDFYYRRQVHSLYAMADDRIGRFSYDVGVRADRVLDYTDITIEGTSRDIKRFDVFPSAHASYDCGKAGTLSAGYSYRTIRPGIWNLEPYITYEDYYTRKIGNPDISPQYIHSAELTWRKSLRGGNSVALTGFLRRSTDVTDWVRRPYAPGITLDSLVNAGNQTEKGLEVSAVLKPTKWWSTTVNGYLFDLDFMSACELCSDRSSWTYQANWINTFSVFRDMKAQLDAHLVGPKVLSQGDEKAYAYADLALRKPLLKDRLTLSLVSRDVFHTARYYSTRYADGLLSVTRIRPKYPNILLGITYNFKSSKHKSSAVTSDLFDGQGF